MIHVKIEGNKITIQDDRNTPFIEEVVITKSELKLINKKVKSMENIKIGQIVIYTPTGKDIEVDENIMSILNDCPENAEPITSFIPVSIIPPKLTRCLVSNGDYIKMAWSKDNDDEGWCEITDNDYDTWLKDVTLWMPISKLPNNKINK